MSSNPTQPKFSDQGDAVNFPPEDDAEGHRFAAAADGGEPEGFRALAMPEGDEDDTEGHGIRFAEGQPDGGPEGHRLVLADGDDDTEGHRLAYYADGDKPQDGPEGLKSLADSDEDDTEGHLAVLADKPEGDGFRSL